MAMLVDVFQFEQVSTAISIEFFMSVSAHVDDLEGPAGVFLRLPGMHLDLFI